NFGVGGFRMRPSVACSISCSLTVGSVAGGSARGKQRTDSTHVLAAIGSLGRLECVGESMRHALNVLAEVAPSWLLEHMDPLWAQRDEKRFSDFRLRHPKRRNG